MPTTCWWRARNESGSQQPCLVAGAASVPAGGLQRRVADDDGGELLGAGHLRSLDALFRRRRLVPSGSAGPAPARFAAAPVRVFRLRAADPDSPGYRHCLEHAGPWTLGLA